MEQAKECISVFCKAQAQLNSIDKKNESERKIIQERIKTCKSLLLDQLSKENISCVEINIEGDRAPMFIRLKPKNVNVTLTVEEVVAVLETNIPNLGELAEDNGYDLPKMLSSVIQEHIRQKRETTSRDEHTLSVTSFRERGFSKHSGSLPHEYAEIAKNMIKDTRELSVVKKNVREEKRPIVEQQKSVEAEVIKAISKHDPKKKTQKIHMNQQEGNSVYYLRCKESIIRNNMGVRKIVPLVENAVNKCLENFGLSRDYVSSMPNKFWADLLCQIKMDYEKMNSEVKKKDKLTLDRAATSKKFS